MSLNSSEFLWSWLKILAALPVVLLLAYVSFKLSRGYANNFRRGLYIKVIETVPVFNKSAVSIVQVGEKYLVLGVSDDSVNVLSELSEEEIEKIKANAPHSGFSGNAAASFLNNKMKNKWNRRQDER